MRVLTEPQRKKLEDLIFFTCERYPIAADLNLLLIEINRKVAALDTRLRMAFRSTDDGVNASHELVLMERLGKIIVGSGALAP